MVWLPATSTVVALARSAIVHCSGGGIIRSSVVTMYQLGLCRHAGSLTVPPSASTPHGTRESPMNAASRGDVRPERGGELLPVEEQEAAHRWQDRRGGTVWGQIGQAEYRPRCMGRARIPIKLFSSPLPAEELYPKDAVPTAGVGDVPRGAGRGHGRARPILGILRFVTDRS
jgi:hypothetical protein